MSGHKAVSAKENPVGRKCCSASSHYWLQHLDRDQDSGRYPQEVALGCLGDQISLHPVMLLCNKPVLESRAGCIWCNLSQPPLAHISQSSPRGCVRYRCTHTCCCKRRSLSWQPTPAHQGHTWSSPHPKEERLWPGCAAGCEGAAMGGRRCSCCSGRNSSFSYTSLPFPSQCSGTAKLGRKFLISAAFFSWQWMPLKICLLGLCLESALLKPSLTQIHPSIKVTC